MELSAVDFIKTLGVSFAALFPIVNPLGDAPIFFGLTRNYPQAAQKVRSSGRHTRVKGQGKSDKAQAKREKEKGKADGFRLARIVTCG